MPGSVAERIKSWNDRAKPTPQPRPLTAQERRQRQQEAQQTSAIQSSGAAAARSIALSELPAAQKPDTFLANKSKNKSTIAQAPEQVAALPHQNARLANDTVPAITKAPEADVFPAPGSPEVAKESLGRRSTQTFQAPATRRTSWAWELQHGRPLAGTIGTHAATVKGVHPEHPEHTSSVDNAFGRKPCPHHKHAYWEGLDPTLQPISDPAIAGQTRQDLRLGKGMAGVSQKSAPISPRTKFTRLDAKEQMVPAQGAKFEIRPEARDNVPYGETDKAEAKLVSFKTPEAKEHLTPSAGGELPSTQKMGPSAAISINEVPQMSKEPSSVPSRVVLPTLPTQAIPSSAEAVTAAVESSGQHGTVQLQTQIPELRSDAAGVQMPQVSAPLPESGSTPAAVFGVSTISDAGQRSNLLSATSPDKSVITGEHPDHEISNGKVIQIVDLAPKAGLSVSVPENEVSVQKDGDGKNTIINASSQPRQAETGTTNTTLLPHEESVNSTAQNTVVPITNSNEDEAPQISSPLQEKDIRDTAIESAVKSLDDLLIEHRTALFQVTSRLSQGLRKMDIDLQTFTTFDQSPNNGRDAAAMATLVPELRKQSQLLSQLLDLINSSIAEWDRGALVPHPPPPPLLSDRADRVQQLRARSLIPPALPIPVPPPLRHATSTPDLSRSGSLMMASAMLSEEVSSVEVLPLGVPGSKCHVFPMCRVTVSPYPAAAARSSRGARRRGTSSQHYWTDDSSSFWEAYVSS